LHRRAVDHDQLVLLLQTGQLLMEYARGDELRAIEREIPAGQVKPLRHRGFWISIDQEHASPGNVARAQRRLPARVDLPTPPSVLAMVIAWPWVYTMESPCKLCSMNS
jgi:hypothetical protein